MPGRASRGAASQRSGVTWLALGPGRRMVGVDPDTLRRWADDGRLRAYATPGGHRRFAVAALQRVVAARRPERRPLAELGATSDRVTRAYARSYRSADAAGPVRDRFGEDDRTAFREDGRRLVEALLGYLDAAGDADRDRWAAEAAGLVESTAVRLRAGGGGICQAIGAFTGAPRPFLTAPPAIRRR